MSFLKRQKALEGLTLEELTARRVAISEDPANANPEHAAGRSLYLYTPQARRKLDDLAWAVRNLLEQRRAAVSR